MAIEWLDNIETVLDAAGAKVALIAPFARAKWERKTGVCTLWFIFVGLSDQFQAIRAS